MVTRNKQSLKLGINLVGLSYDIKTKDQYVALLAKYGSKLTAESAFGAGFGRYQGRESADGSIFLGWSEKTFKGILVFSKQEGFEQAIQFIELLKSSNLPIGFTSCSVGFGFGPSSLIKTKEELDKGFQSLINIQRKSLPKVSVDKESVLLGGKTSEAFIKINGVIAANQTCLGSELFYKCNGKKVARLNDLVFQNDLTTISLKTILALLVVEQLQTVILTPYLENLRSEILRSFDVGSVNVFVESKSLTKTAQGKSIQRILTSMKNKFFNKTTSKEAFSLFVLFLKECLKDPSFKDSFTKEFPLKDSSNADPKSSKSN